MYKGRRVASALPPCLVEGSSIGSTLQQHYYYYIELQIYTIIGGGGAVVSTVSCCEPRVRDNLRFSLCKEICVLVAQRALLVLSGLSEFVALVALLSAGCVGACDILIAVCRILMRMA